MPDSDISGRVRQVWSARGESQGAFAARISMEESAFSRSLSGQRRFTSVELARIAQLTGTSIDWLVMGVAPPSPALAARTSERVEAGGVDKAVQVADFYGGYAGTLGEVGARFDVAPLPKVPSSRGLDVERAEQLAETALAWIDDHEGPEALELGGRFLSDLPSLVEDVFGINVAIQDLGRGFDGLSWCLGDFRLALLTSGTHWTRQRYTLAHEVGHILFGDSQTLRVDEDVTARGADGSERRAGAFAAAFLMPAELVRTAASHPDHEVEFCALAGRFNVSPAALAWRLYNLGLITKDRQSDLGAITTSQAAQRGGWADRYARFAVQQTQSRRPRLLAATALAAYDAGLVSARLPAAILDIDADDLVPAPSKSGEGDPDDFRP